MVECLELVEDVAGLVDLHLWDAVRGGDVGISGDGEFDAAAWAGGFTEGVIDVFLRGGLDVFDSGDVSIADLSFPRCDG